METFVHKLYAKKWKQLFSGNSANLMHLIIHQLEAVSRHSDLPLQVRENYALFVFNLSQTFANVVWILISFSVTVIWSANETVTYLK